MAINNILGQIPHGVYLASYNGYTFDPATTYTEGINSVVVPDSSGRTVKAIETTLALVTQIFTKSPITTDATMEALEQRLMSQGGALYYRDKGFGDFQVNVPGGRKKDIAWGPIPTHFRAKPKGDAFWWEVAWGVKTIYPWCDGARFENDIAEWNYQVYYDYDDGKYESRRIQGHIEIPMTRSGQGDRFVRASADDYRELVMPRCPAFFQPGSSYYNLSEDRRKLIFNCNYDQFPGPIPPPGIRKVEMGTELASETMALTTWNWTLRASYELMQGKPHAIAAKHFIDSASEFMSQIDAEINAQKLAQPDAKVNFGAKLGPVAPGVKDILIDGIPAVRIGQGIAGAIRDTGKEIADAIRNIFPGLNRKKGPSGFHILPVSITSGNPDRFGKPKAHFSLNCRVFGTRRCWLMAGLWGKLPGDDNWNAWRKSAGDLFGARGAAGGHFDPNDDVIIDLCRPGTSTLKAKRPRPEPGRKLITIPTPGGPIPIVIDPEDSYMEYEMNVDLLQDDAVLSHKPLPVDASLRANRGFSTLRAVGGAVGAGGNGAGAWSAFIPAEDLLSRPFRPGSLAETGEFASTIIRQAASTYGVLLTGHGVRIGGPPDAPGLLSIGGVPAVSANQSLLGDGFRQKVIGNVGVPIHYGMWQFRYLLPGAPGAKTKDADTDSIIPIRNTAPRGNNAPPPADGILGRLGALAGSLPANMRRF